MTPDRHDWREEEEQEQRHRWRDTDGNVDRFQAALKEWLRRGEESHD